MKHTPANERRKSRNARPNGALEGGTGARMGNVVIEVIIPAPTLERIENPMQSEMSESASIVDRRAKDTVRSTQPTQN